MTCGVIIHKQVIYESVCIYPSTSYRPLLVGPKSPIFHRLPPRIMMLKIIAVITDLVFTCNTMSARPNCMVEWRLRISTVSCGQPTVAAFDLQRA